MSPEAWPEQVSEHLVADRTNVVGSGSGGRDRRVGRSGPASASTARRQACSAVTWSFAISCERCRRPARRRRGGAGGRRRSRPRARPRYRRRDLGSSWSSARAASKAAWSRSVSAAGVPGAVSLASGCRVRQRDLGSDADAGRRRGRTRVFRGADRGDRGHGFVEVPPHQRGDGGERFAGLATGGAHLDLVAGRYAERGQRADAAAAHSSGPSVV